MLHFMFFGMSLPMSSHRSSQAISVDHYIMSPFKMQLIIDHPLFRITIEDMVAHRGLRS